MQLNPRLRILSVVHSTFLVVVRGKPITKQLGKESRSPLSVSIWIELFLAETNLSVGIVFKVLQLSKSVLSMNNDLVVIPIKESLFAILVPQILNSVSSGNLESGRKSETDVLSSRRISSFFRPIKLVRSLISLT